MLMVLVVTCNCRFAENRRNQRKSTPKGGGNSPKSGDDRIGQVFVYVIAGSNGFQWVAALPIGSVRKAVIDDSRRRIFWIFFHIFSPYGADSPFQMRVTHKNLDSSLYTFSPHCKNGSQESLKNLTWIWFNRLYYSKIPWFFLFPLFSFTNAIPSIFLGQRPSVNI